MEWKINCSLPDVRPHFLRILICCFYVPMVTPIILILGLFLEKFNIKIVFQLWWNKFIIPCFAGKDI